VAPNSPVVSVVVPCYNYGRYLETCIASVLGQAGVDTRVLIIDDCSSDDSAAVGEGLAERFENVEFRRHVINRGHIATYNEGLLEWADGDYVTLLSADDLLTDGSLLRSVELMEQRPSVGLVYGRSEDFSDDLNLPPVGKPRAPLVHEGHRWLARRFRQGVNVVPTPGTVVRTSVHRRVGGYDPTLPHAGDFEVWLRIAAVSDVGFIRGAAQGYYRIHGASMSAGVYQTTLADIRQRRLVFESVRAKCGPELERAGISAGATEAALASETLWRACRAYEKGIVSQAPMEEFLEFAQETHPDPSHLRAYRALQRRQRLGEPVCHRTQLFIGTAAVRKAGNIYWWIRWKRRGG